MNARGEAVASVSYKGIWEGQFLDRTMIAASRSLEHLRVGGSLFSNVNHIDRKIAIVPRDGRAGGRTGRGKGKRDGGWGEQEEGELNPPSSAP